MSRVGEYHAERRRRVREVVRARLRRDSETGRRFFAIRLGWADECVACLRALEAGDEAVYRHRPETVYCIPCARGGGVPFRHSFALDRAHLQEVQ